MQVVAVVAWFNNISKKHASLFVCVRSFEVRYESLLSPERGLKEKNNGSIFCFACMNACGLVKKRFLYYIDLHIMKE